MDAIVSPFCKMTERANPMIQLCALLGWVVSAHAGFPFAAVGSDFNPDEQTKIESVQQPPPDTVSIDGAIYQILEANCFRCHGPKKHQADLRLDTRENLMQGGASGPAIVPGDANDSLLYQRITDPSDEDRMPYGEDRLSEEQIDWIRNWINRGAPWPVDTTGTLSAEITTHWAYLPPKRPDIPVVHHKNWVNNPIDSFILQNLESLEIEPNPEARKEELIRRVSLDLTGLPPSLSEVEDYLNDEKPDAYERLVARLLASRRYGEHWARLWLDLARYADTNGYEKDLPRSMWLWRDWVINAFNSNMPFDQFTVEQLAGDLLEKPSLDQLIATGFHRNTLLNDEDGIDPEEFRVEAVKDRVDTTAAVWLGITLQCAQCHNHKHDPFTQKEYYQFFAFFNHTKDSGWKQEPILKLPSQEQSIRSKELDDKIHRLEDVLKTHTPESDSALSDWENTINQGTPDWSLLVPNRFSTREGSSLVLLEDASLLASDKNAHGDITFVTATIPVGDVTHLKLEILRHESLPEGGAGRGRYGGFIITGLRGKIYPLESSHSAIPLQVSNAYADRSDPGYDPRDLLDVMSGIGWGGDLSEGDERQNYTAILEITDTGRIPPGSTLVMEIDSGGGFQNNIGRFRMSVTGATTVLTSEFLPPTVRSAIETPKDLRADKEREALQDFFRLISPQFKEERKELALARKEVEGMQIPSTLVMEELPEARETRILVRGNFLNVGPKVEPAVPEILHDFPMDQPRNRLGLARWLVSRENPLVARVIVNRLWASLFGSGLVETVEDFGSHGLPPTYPGLLDYLAVEFMETGWDIKGLLSQIVLSSTYRQSSRIRPLLQERDPQTRLYARGPRYRMDAEMIRDNALAVSGLLNPQIGGPSVFPPQPKGTWEASFANAVRTTHDWEESTTDQRYRRGVYTYQRRTAPYPSFSVFDAPSREVCTLKRERSNHPLQALTTLNDPTFIEAAGALAKRIYLEGGENLDDRVKFAYRVCFAREPKPSEVKTQALFYRETLGFFQRKKENAEALITQTRQGYAGVEPAELAAWTMVANVFMNLDESVTKQ